MTDDEVWSTVLKWLGTVLNVTVIRSYESGPRPATPYVMVNFTGSRAIHAHERGIIFADRATNEAPDTNGEYPPVLATPLIDVEWRYSVHAYGSTPSDILRPLESARRLTQILEPMFPDLVLHSTSQIRYVPEWVNEEWEPRANVDIFVRGLTRDGFEIDTIDAIPVDIDRMNP